MPYFKPELLAALMVFGIPILGILTRHQRKMAEIIHQNARQTMPSPDTQMLREDILELKALVHQQAIALDNLVRPVPGGERIQERVA